MKRKKRSAAIGPTKAMFAGVLFAFLSFFLVSFIFSLFIYSMSDPTKNLGILSLVALLVSGAVCAFVISKVRGEGGILTAILSCLMFSLIGLIVGLIAEGGNLSLACPFNYLCYMGTAALFAFLGKRKNKRTRY